MEKYVLSKKDLQGFIGEISNKNRVYAPVKNNGMTFFKEIKKPSEVINRDYWKRFFSLPTESVFIDSCIELIKDSGLTIQNKELIESTILTETNDDTLTVSNDDLKRFYTWLYNFIK